jgi:phosphoglycerate dehydrogenase-like enzyme
MIVPAAAPRPLTVLLNGPIARQGAGALRRRFGDRVRLLEVAEPAASAAEFAAADVLVTVDLGSGLPPMPRLKLIAMPVAGLDAIDLEAVPAGCPVCNTFEHEIGISEYVLAAMLHWTVGLSGRDARFRAASWEDSPRLSAPFRPELAGKTVGCIGYGHIGQAVAIRARAFGMRVLAIVHRPRPLEPAPDWLGGPGELGHLLEESDFVVIACPLTAATQGLIGRVELAHMRQAAVLINVARGAIVDEEALFAALQARTIGGAVLDTWYRYPSGGDASVRPSRHPFHELDNVVMTPHCSGWTEGLMERRFAVIADNLERLIAGQPLVNQVHPPLRS